MSMFQCSSASRKFLNTPECDISYPPNSSFSALQRAENSSIRRSPPITGIIRTFQCSSASRKFLNRKRIQQTRSTDKVSVLFSEPKIPQFASERPRRRRRRSEFQCSSASRKFLNTSAYAASYLLFQFQCSSASRKFLNRPKQSRVWCGGQCFSALQRAENSSIVGSMTLRRCSPASVSVLFSEPKIPQSGMESDLQSRLDRSFSALQRAENSSMVRPRTLSSRRYWFQCSSASRKFLNSIFEASTKEMRRSFSALQRAENSSMQMQMAISSLWSPFQCSSASRKFLNRRSATPPPAFACVSVLFSEPKIPQCRMLGTCTECRKRVSVLFSEPKIPQYRGDTI